MTKRKRNPFIKRLFARMLEQALRKDTLGPEFMHPVSWRRSNVTRKTYERVFGITENQTPDA